jgi:hypothetical protein
MADTRVLKHLANEINERVGQYTEALASGNCKDHAEYASITGVIRGLRMVLGDIGDLVKRLEGGEEDVE